MTNFIPVFPLNIVVYPGEALNLHIFEQRYIQMIQDCIRDKKSFGLPPVLEKSMNGELGTLMEITELVKTHDDGTLDIRTRGVSVFRILERIDSIPEKLYSGAIVNYPENVSDPGNSQLSKALVEEVRRLFSLLKDSEHFPEVKEEMSAYELAHLIGLNQEQEYELLGLFKEIHRLEYIRRHLANVVPVVQELEKAKQRIRHNGHFRDLSLGDFGL